MPNLIENQLSSYNNFLQKDVPPEERKLQGLQEVFLDVFPINDFNDNMVLEFVDYTIEDPPYTSNECRERDLTYSSPLKIRVRLISKRTGEVKEQEIFVGDLPMMTDKGTFVINGAERVVVTQLHRSPGVFYEELADASGRRTFSARVIPYRGAWIEFSLDSKDIVYVRLNRRRKMLATALLRTLGYSTDEEILELFDNSPIIQATLEKDYTNNREEALVEIYRRLRPGDPPQVESAQGLLRSLLSDPKKYDLARVGRHNMNKKLGLNFPLEERTIIEIKEGKIIDKGIVASLKYLVGLPEGKGTVDDIDHLGKRRVRSVGELLQNQFRIGLVRMERVARERMTIQPDSETTTPQTLINIRPIVAAIRGFFGGSQLSQFMDQVNPLAELAHKRRLSALGPGGLKRDRAGFEVRDVHNTHYGRICPIETPEGPNIGLIGNLGTYALISDFGYIQAPYRRVVEGVVTDEIRYLTADEEDEYVIAQANAPLDEEGHFLSNRVTVRYQDEIKMVSPEEVNFMDVSPKQIVSVATSLIPFLEHDDAGRALMGANMQRQAVPLIRTEAPLIGTGMEYRAAKDSGAVVVAKRAGIVGEVTADRIVVIPNGCEERTEGERIADVYELMKFKRSNQDTCINQRPIVRKGQRIERDQVIADGAATDHGELALGANVLVAFMSWEGYNYEDAIVISEKLVGDDIFTSIHIEKYEVEARDTKLGPEEITRDIPNIGEEALRNLDEDGIVRVGAEVTQGDILVGKITPKGETELTAEAKLLRAIFGEKAREVRDTSLRVPHGEGGCVISTTILSRHEGHELPPGVNKMVRVYVAVKRKITEGDKMAGRHGNKGVIAKVVPEEDMPFLEDGTPIEIILNPLGVPSRMNIGQILETHLGWTANKMGYYIASPVFDGAKEDEIRKALISAGLPEDGKAVLYDGRTGLPFDQKITVGYIYMMKLAHLVDDKIHARSTGPYSVITQQPLGGKAQFGGQRFGEMEVWALEAYGAAHTLQEMLTIKSDDVTGRVKAYEAIVKGEQLTPPGIPESFKVLIKELQSLAVDVKLLDKNGSEIKIDDEESDYDIFHFSTSRGLSLASEDEEAEAEGELEGDEDYRTKSLAN